MCFLVLVWNRNMEFSENRVPGVALGPSLPARPGLPPPTEPWVSVCLLEPAVPTCRSHSGVRSPRCWGGSCCASGDQTADAAQNTSSRCGRGRDTLPETTVRLAGCRLRRTAGAKHCDTEQSQHAADTVVFTHRL